MADLSAYTADQIIALSDAQLLSAYPNLSRDEIDTLMEFYNFLPKDANGQVDRDNVLTACEFDIDADGVITTAERATCAAGWLSSFASQDTDSSNDISPHELLTYNNGL